MSLVRVTRVTPPPRTCTAANVRRAAVLALALLLLALPGTAQGPGVPPDGMVMVGLLVADGMGGAHFAWAQPVLGVVCGPVP